MVRSNIASVIISISALFHCLDFFVTVHENRTTRVITVAFLFYCYDHWNSFRFVYFYFPRFAFSCFKKMKKTLKKKSRYCFMIAWQLESEGWGSFLNCGGYHIVLGSPRCIRHIQFKTRVLLVSCKADLLISKTHISLYSPHTHTHISSKRTTHQASETARKHMPRSDELFQVAFTV